MLYVTKLLQHFPCRRGWAGGYSFDEMLKAKVGSGTILEDTPAHLPLDESCFSLRDVIAGPLDVIPLKGSIKFNVSKYEEVANAFEILRNWIDKALCTVDT